MRVEPDDLKAITNRVIKEGRRYGSIDLDGAAMDVDHALYEAGFTPPKIKKTGELKRMVLYTCRPNWSGVDADNVVPRLEDGWVENGAFENEAHSILVGDTVTLDFVTWWDHGDFYTGRIEVMLDPPA